MSTHRTLLMICLAAAVVEPAMAEFKLTATLTTLGPAELAAQRRLPPMNVKAYSDMQAPQQGDQARGVVRAGSEATLSSRLAARIVKLPLKEGQSFKKGEVLVEFDCARPSAEARAAHAQMMIQAKNVETNVELDKFNSIGKNDLAISRSQFDKAKAEHEALTAQLADCRITAPFNGRVVETVARNHEAVAVSQPLLKVVDTGDMEIDLIVPSAWLQWLKPGSGFEFKVDETGQVYGGQVQRINAAVDPVSKTVKIVGRFKGRGTILPGMSGTGHFAKARS